MIGSLVESEETRVGTLVAHRVNACGGGAGTRWVRCEVLIEGREFGHMAQEGTVKWFSEEKGYGFIIPDAGGEGYLVHYTGVRGTGFRALAAGQKVSYELTHGRAGRSRATNVTKAREH